MNPNPLLARRFRLTARWTALAVAAIGIISLAGRAYGAPLLTSVLPGMPAMKANAASCLALAGIALWLKTAGAREDAAGRWTTSRIPGVLADACALMVAVTGLLTLLEYACGWDFGIDQLLFQEKTKELLTLYPGRMALSTATAFLLAGLAVTLLDRIPRGWTGLVQMLGLTPGFLALLSLAAYIHGLTAFSMGMAVYTAMALNTALVFMLLSAGILFARPERGWMTMLVSDGPHGMAARRLVPVVLLTPLLLDWLVNIGEARGFYNDAFDGTVSTVAVTAVMLVMLWWTTAAVRQTHTRQTEAEQKLAQSAALLRTVVNASPDLIFVKDNERRIVLCNESFALTIGTSPEELYGKTEIEAGLPPEVVAGDPAKGIRGFEEDDRAALAGKTLRTTESVCIGGVEHCLDTIKLPLRDERGEIFGMLGTSRDITAQKEAESMLRTAEERFRTIVNGSLDGILLADARTMKYTFANDAMCRMTGYSQGELLSMGVDDLHPATDLPYVKRQFVMQAQTPGSLSRNIPVKRKDGSIFFADVGAAPLVFSGTTCLAGFFHDLTEQKRLEAQFAHAQKMETVGRLAGGIAHDFNNILQAVIGTSEILLDGMTPADPRHKEVAEIKKAAHRAADLTRQLLAFSRKQVIAPKSVDLNGVIINMEKMLFRLIGEDVRLALDLAGGLHPVKADASQLEQVILNLVVNARDAMPSGGRITISTANAQVTDGVDAVTGENQTGRFVCLAVTDTGTGMDEETRRHLFEPFFTTKGVGRGTGLGLAAVSGIVRQHDGWIEVATAEGRGTTFRIHLPALGEAAEKTAAGGGKETTLPSKGRGEPILMVEDDELVRAITSSILRSAGYDVTTAGSVGEALAMLKGRPSAFRLLFSDVVLPDMSGVELAEKARALDPGIAVILCSGYPDKHIPIIGEKGMLYLQKPVTGAVLLEAVRQVLDADEKRKAG